MNIQELYQHISGSTATFSTDSRTVEPGDVYIALRGEIYDGNAFVRDVLEKGVSFAIVDRPEAVVNDQCILVENTLTTLQNLATYHRSLFTIPVLAIGGSNGKTTTKELVHAVLSQKYTVHVTKGNLNNDIGVPLTLLALKKDHDIAVIEIGANHPGEHTTLMNIVSPTHILVTNNGADHLEGFGSLEGVRTANKEIYDWARAHSTHAFVNKDLPDLVEDSTSLERTLYPTAQYESTSTLYAELRYKNTEFPTQLFGSFNEANILATITIGEAFNIHLPAIAESVHKYIPTLKRSQIIEKDNYTLILDCYNANPSSMELSLADFFKTSKNRERIMIVGDMLELGTVEREAHKNILALLKKLHDPADIIICVGPRFGMYKHDFPFLFYEESEKARAFFNTIDLSNKSIFAKGSRGIKIENVLQEKIPL